MRVLASTIVTSPLGDLVIGASEGGCCLVEYVDRGGLPAIRKRIERRNSGAPIAAESDWLSLIRSELEQYFAGRLRRFSFPIDLQGSAFERAVWEALLAIPYGQTATYGDVANAVHRPLAARAVGRANGTNPLAIVVPCHRVVQADGGMRGYGGGIWRKRFLLDLEARIAGAGAGS